MELSGVGSVKAGGDRRLNWWVERGSHVGFWPCSGGFFW